MIDIAQNRSSGPLVSLDALSPSVAVEPTLPTDWVSARVQSSSKGPTQLGVVAPGRRD
jgi:hypothetical protein